MMSNARFRASRSARLASHVARSLSMRKSSVWSRSTSILPSLSAVDAIACTMVPYSPSTHSCWLIQDTCPNASGPHRSTIFSQSQGGLSMQPFKIALATKSHQADGRTSMSGVQVLKDSHPRQGGMDEDECEQCIHDIVSWFQRKADLSERAAKSTDVDSLEEELGREIPEALRILLKKQSGGLWFDEYRSLTPSDIVRTAEKLAGVGGWKTSFIPFAADLDGNALITDAASKNAVYIFGDDGKGRQLAPTLSEYLEEYRNRLLSGQFDYVEDVGLVERSRK